MTNEQLKTAIGEAKARTDWLEAAAEKIDELEADLAVLREVGKTLRFTMPDGTTRFVSMSKATAFEVVGLAMGLIESDVRAIRAELAPSSGPCNSSLDGVECRRAAGHAGPHRANGPGWTREWAALEAFKPAGE